MQKLTTSNVATSTALVTLAVVAALVVSAVVSATVLADHFSSPETYAHEMAELDEKRDTVMGMSVSAATASAAITLIPSDVCTPIADKLAQISLGLTAIVGAIVFEKYLMTTMGLILFGAVIPTCCVMLVCSLLLARNYKKVSDFLIGASAIAMVVTGVLWVSVPVSIAITDTIEDTYQGTIDAAINSAEEASVIQEQLSEPAESDENMSLAERAYDFFFGAGSPVNSAVSTANDMVNWAETVLSNFIEGIAVMAVTTCVIPALVPMLILHVAKLIFHKYL